MNNRADVVFRQSQQPGLTLVEIIITIAVSAIIVALTFNGLRSEQLRSATKDAAERLQIELLSLQNKMQAGVSLTSKFCIRGGGNYTYQGKLCATDTDCLTNPGGVQGRCVTSPPGGYGLSVLTTGITYNLFADMPNGTTPVNGIYDTSATNDIVLTGNKSLGQNIQVTRLTSNGSANATRLDISFSGVNGQVIIYDPTAGSCGSACTTAKIVLKHTKTGACYSITIDKTSQIVSRRQFSPSCT